MGAAAPHSPLLPASISFMGWEQGQKGLGRGAEQALLPMQHKPSATVPESTTLCALGGQEGPAVTSGNAAAAGVGSRGPEASAGPTAPGLRAGLGDAEQGRGDAAGAGRQQEGGCSPWPPFGHRHQVGCCTLPSSSGSCSAAGLVLCPAATGSPIPTSPGAVGVLTAGPGLRVPGGSRPRRPGCRVPAAVALAAAGPLTEAVAQNLVIKGRGQVIGFCKSNQVH